MMMNRERLVAWACCLLCCGAFALAGLILLPYPGVQYDEVLFVTAIYNPQHVEYPLKTSFGQIPLMLMTYVGTLKAAIYAPILSTFGAGLFVLRLPPLALGVLSIAIFFFVARRLAGTAIAALASLLLATDAVYLLTCVFDWGPVAIQHALFAGALYCGVRYAQGPRAIWLFLGGLASGLALWDKALFAWILAGVGLGLLAVYPKDLWRIARDRRMFASAAFGFLLGAAPFLYYNSFNKFKTFAENTREDEAGWAWKVNPMDRTFDGSGLFGYLVREDPEGPPANLKTWEKVPLFLVQRTGGHRNGLQHILLAIALALAPLAASGHLRRLAIFIAIAFIAGWLLMMMTRGAGGSQHHTILLWPLPQLSLAVLLSGVAARFSKRGLKIGAAAVLVGVLSNGFVLNQYWAHFVACGPTWIWSDAIRPLVNEIGRIQGRHVFAADWGILQQIEYFSRGTVSFHRPSDGILTSIHEPLSVAYLEKSLADPSTLFVTRTEGREAFQGVRAKLLEFAAQRGYNDTLLKVINDRHGAPIFEIHEFRK